MLQQLLFLISSSMEKNKSFNILIVFRRCVACLLGVSWLYNRKNLKSRFVQQLQQTQKDKILIVTSNQIILEEGK